MTDKITKLREKYRSEWENRVISLINQGWSKSDAQNDADECLLDKYFYCKDD